MTEGRRDFVAIHSADGETRVVEATVVVRGPYTCWELATPARVECGDVVEFAFPAGS